MIYVPGPSDRRYPMLPLSQTAGKNKEDSDVRHIEASLHNMEKNWWKERFAQISCLVKENVGKHLPKDPFNSTYHI